MYRTIAVESAEAATSGRVTGTSMVKVGALAAAGALHRLILWGRARDDPIF
jgi:hypothetical protein